MDAVAEELSSGEEFPIDGLEKISLKFDFFPSQHIFICFVKKLMYLKKVLLIHIVKIKS